MSTPPNVALEVLLRYDEEEAQHWEDWLRKNSRALQVQILAGETVRDRIFHLFTVQHRSAQRLLGEAMTPDAEFKANSLAELFDIGRRSRAKLRQALQNLTPQQLGQPREFHSSTIGNFQATPRKIFLHCIVHSVRHWAQIAMSLRAHGLATDWSHDVIMSKAVE